MTSLATRIVAALAAAALLWIPTLEGQAAQPAAPAALFTLA